MYFTLYIPFVAVFSFVYYFLSLTELEYTLSNNSVQDRQLTVLTILTMC
jgi:hypothetical protein